MSITTCAHGYSRLVREGMILGCLVAVNAGTATAQSWIPIARLERPPVMTGTLSDPLWRQATRFTAFKTLHPQAGGEPSESTEVYVAHDRANLYVGVRSHPSRH